MAFLRPVFYWEILHHVDRDVFLVVVEFSGGTEMSDQLFFQLGNAVDLSVGVIHNTLAAGFNSLDGTADAQILHVKAVGLVFLEPLFLESKVEIFRTFDHFPVITDNGIQLLFVAGNVSFTGTCADGGFDRQDSA